LREEAGAIAGLFSFQSKPVRLKIRREEPLGRKLELRFVFPTTLPIFSFHVFFMIESPRLLVCWITLFFCGACASSKLAQYTDYSVAVGQAYATEQAVAQKRVNQYLSHLKPAEKERLASVEYIAVEATTVPISEVPGLASRIANGRLRREISITSSDPHEAISGSAKFIMIFDPKTGQPLNQEGYVAVETPAKGKIGIFGGYTALYIGNGR
jgi:hypothetical protein